MVVENLSFFFFQPNQFSDPVCCRAGVRAGAGADGQGRAAGKGPLLFAAVTSALDEVSL